MNKPTINLGSIVGAAIIYFGLLLFIISLHIITIDAEGNIQAVLNTTFIVFLWIYIGSVIFGIIGLLIQFLKYIYWQATTPEWMKKGGFQ